jgi:hypothetical protein
MTMFYAVLYGFYFFMERIEYLGKAFISNGLKPSTKPKLYVKILFFRFRKFLDGGCFALKDCLK